MLPKLEGIQVVDVDWNELVGVDINQNAPANKKLESHARDIAAVARKILQETDENSRITDVAPMYDTRPIHEITSNFTQRVISFKEQIWFQERNTGNKVIAGLRREQDILRATPWKWVSMPEPNQEQLDAYQLILLQRERAIMKQCQELLVRKRQGRAQTTEVIARPGNMDPDALAARSEAMSRVCIAAQDGNNDCGGLGPYHTCTTCNTRCCSLHGPDHLKHVL
jgi:hypothetical protein